MHACMVMHAHPRCVRRSKARALHYRPPQLLHLSEASRGHAACVCTPRLTQGDTAARAVNNTVMELRNIANHPFISKLHPAGAEERVPAAPHPPLITLCGKMALLDRLLVKLHATGHKVHAGTPHHLSTLARDIHVCWRFGRTEWPCVYGHKIAVVCVARATFTYNPASLHCIQTPLYGGLRPCPRRAACRCCCSAP